MYTIRKAETAKAVLLLDIEVRSICTVDSSLISNPILNPFTPKISPAY